MRDDEGLLQAIGEAPEDDLPRLVYADWLDENGQSERAELIRVQIALACLPKRGANLEGPDLRQREQELLAAHREAWTKDVPSWASGGVFRRGLVGRVNASVADFVGRGAELACLAGLEGVRLHNATGLVSSLAGSPHLARLSYLHLSGHQIDAAGVGALVASPHLTRLASLDLGFNEIGETGARALAGSPHLAGLASLALGYNRIGAAGAQALAGSPHLAGLVALDLSENGVGDAGAEALAGSPHLAGLSSLSLYSNQIGDAGALALAGSTDLAGLTSLDLRGNQIGGEAAETLRQRFGRAVLL